MSDQIGIIQLNQAKNKNLIPDSELLTNLDWLRPGEYFPPASQIPRLNRYKRNKLKFDNDVSVNQDAYNYIIQLVNDRFRVISYRMLVNLYRKVSYRTADFLFVERPVYITSPKKQDTLDTIVRLSKLGSLGHKGALDISRFGEAIFTVKVKSIKNKKDEDVQDGTRLGITNPSYWFPVVKESDLTEIKYHVIAYIVVREIILDGKSKDQKYVMVQIHDKGKYIKREYLLEDDGKLGDPEILENGMIEEEVETGLTDFAIQPIQGVVTSDSIFGIDDYTDLIPLIEELETRLEKVAHVLDKHSDPSLTGPASALTKDQESGEYYLKLDGYFVREDKEDPGVEYLTWDAQLDPSFKEIEIIMDLLAIISEMGAAIFDSKGAGMGSQISGRALKLLYVNPLTKVSRVRNNFDDGFKQALAICSELGYGDDQVIDQGEISINWKDGLPDDPKENAEIEQIRLGNRANQTLTASVMNLDNLSRGEAEIKVLEIEAENKADIPGIDADHNFMEDITGPPKAVEDEEE